MRYRVYVFLHSVVEVTAYTLKVDDDGKGIRTWPYSSTVEVFDLPPGQSVDIRFTQPIVRITDDHGREVYKIDEQRT